MGDTLKITPDYLRDLKLKVNNLLEDLKSNHDVTKLAEWGNVPLGHSTWSNSGTGGTGGAGGDGGSYLVHPGNTTLVPAKRMQQAATGYAGGLVNAVNWVTDVLQSLSDNIDTTLAKMSSTEHDNEISANDLYGGLGDIIGQLGGQPGSSLTPPPTTTPTA